MAADRTTLNALIAAVVDDDGSGLTGTVWVKALLNSFLQALADIIDAVIGDPASWTPVFGGSTSQSGQVYATQAGTYTKHGKQVTFDATITLSTLGTITGSVLVGGLPVNAAADSAIVIGLWSNLSTNMVWLGGYVIGGTKNIQIECRISAGTGTTSIVQGDLSATTSLRIAGAYVSQ